VRNELDTSSKIAIAALVVSAISALFTGLTYYSNEASKRAALSVLILEKQYGLKDVNITLSSGRNYTEEIDFSITGIVNNEGSRKCLIENLSLVWFIPLSESMIEDYKITNQNVGDIAGFILSFVRETGNSLGWDNRVIVQGESKNFTLSHSELVDDYYRGLKSNLISYCLLRIYYNDDLGQQLYEKKIENLTPMIYGYT